MEVILLLFLMLLVRAVSPRVNVLKHDVDFEMTREWVLSRKTLARYIYAVNTFALEDKMDRPWVYYTDEVIKELETQWNVEIVNGQIK